ncbi:MAG: hypothetical protein ACKVHO_07380 [Verrucomicrobiia bacterium]|jgi:hypothetical protein
MNEFDDKWQAAAEAARSVSQSPIPEIPLGFSGRVVALSQELESAMPSWFSAFERYLLRMTAGVGLAVLVAGAVQLNEFMAPPSLLPTVENIVVERFPLL